jgi:iron transport multicopper oxidase
MSSFAHSIDYLRGEVLTDMLNYANPALVTEQNAIMRYAGISDTIMPNSTVPVLGGVPQGLNTTSLVPAIPVEPPASTRTEIVFVTFQVTAQGTWGSFVNGTSWTAETSGNATLFQTAEAAITGSSWTSDSQFIVTNNDVEVFDLVINKFVVLTSFVSWYSPLRVIVKTMATIPFTCMVIPRGC